MGGVHVWCNEKCQRQHDRHRCPLSMSLHRLSFHFHRRLYDIHLQFNGKGKSAIYEQHAKTFHQNTRSSPPLPRPSKASLRRPLSQFKEYGRLGRELMSGPVIRTYDPYPVAEEDEEEDETKVCSHPRGRVHCTKVPELPPDALLGIPATPFRSHPFCKRRPGVTMDWPNGGASDDEAWDAFMNDVTDVDEENGEKQHGRGSPLGMGFHRLSSQFHHGLYIFQLRFELQRQFHCHWLAPSHQHGLPESSLSQTRAALQTACTKNQFHLPTSPFNQTTDEPYRPMEPHGMICRNNSKRRYRIPSPEETMDDVDETCFAYQSLNHTRLCARTLKKRRTLAPKPPPPLSLQTTRSMERDGKQPTHLPRQL